MPSACSARDMAKAVKTRLHIPEPIAAGTTVILSPAQSHHVRTVLRLRPGDPVAVFNGRDGEWRAVVEDGGKHATTVVVDRSLRSQTTEPDVTLLFAPVKRLRIDYLVEKATELGVARLIPVLTARTDVARLNAERLVAHAVAAAEQSHRLSVPRVLPPHRLKDIVDMWNPQIPLFVCAEFGPTRPILAALADSTTGAAGLLTGPEGGFAETELDALRALPFVVAVRLGPRILRAETAALAALACWQACCGDWRTPAAGTDGDGAAPSPQARRTDPQRESHD